VTSPGIHLARGESGHGGNTAVVVLVAAHHDKSAHSPVSSPAVLNKPVLGSRGSTPSNAQHTVVQLLRRACRLIVDSSRVELEGGLRGINGNRGRSSVGLHLEVVLVSAVDVDKAGESGTRVGSIVGAGSILSSVWVRGFSVNSLVGDDVGHGLSHESSIASLVSLAP